MKKRVRVKVLYDDEAILPRMKGWKMVCCDCGLVHIVRFKIVKRKGKRVVWLKARRDNRATAGTRRRKQVKR